MTYENLIDKAYLQQYHTAMKKYVDDKSTGGGSVVELQLQSVESGSEFVVYGSDNTMRYVKGIDGNKIVVNGTDGSWVAVGDGDGGNIESMDYETFASEISQYISGGGGSVVELGSTSNGSLFVTYTTGDTTMRYVTSIDGSSVQFQGVGSGRFIPVGYGSHSTLTGVSTKTFANEIAQAVGNGTGETGVLLIGATGTEMQQLNLSIFGSMISQYISHDASLITGITTQYSGGAYICIPGDASGSVYKISVEDWLSLSGNKSVAETIGSYVTKTVHGSLINFYYEALSGSAILTTTGSGSLSVSTYSSFGSTMGSYVKNFESANASTAISQLTQNEDKTGLGILCVYDQTGSQAKVVTIADLKTILGIS